MTAPSDQHGLFDPPSSAASDVTQSEPAPGEWAAQALAILFAGRGAALKQLQQPERDAIAAAAWLYACAREDRAMARPGAAESADALLGQHTRDDALARATTLLHHHRLEPSDIPASTRGR